MEITKSFESNNDTNNVEETTTKSNKSNNTDTIVVVVDRGNRKEQFDDQEDEDDSNNKNHNRKEHDIVNQQEQQLQRAEKKEYNMIRLGLYIFSVLYTTLFSGAFFGWGPMELLLEQDDAYAFSCTESTTMMRTNDYNDTTATTTIDSTSSSICTNQTKHLLTIHFVATLTLILSPIFGHIADMKPNRNNTTTTNIMKKLIVTIIGYGGPITLLKIMFILECFGIGLLILSRMIRIDWLLYIAFSCIASVSFATNVVSVSTGMMLYDDTNDQGRRRVISSLNMFFDAGSITYWFLWYIHEKTTSYNYIDDITIENDLNDDDDDNDIALVSTFEIILFGYLLVAIISFGGTLFFWKKLSSSNQIENNVDFTSSTVKTTTVNATTKEEEGCCFETNDIITINIEEHNTTSQNDDSNKNNNNNNIMIDNNNDSEIIVNGKDDIIVDNNTILCTTTTTTTTTAIDGNHRLPDNKHSKLSDDDDYPLVTASTTQSITTTKPKEQQLLSIDFLSLVLFFCFHLCRNLFTLTTTRDNLEYLGDDDHTYLTIFTLLMPASILGFPFVDIALSKYGYHIGFQFVNLLGILHGCIQVLSIVITTTTSTSTSSNTILLKIQIIGFILFSFYRSFLFSVVFSFIPNLIHPTIVGKATGMILVLGGIASFINIPLGRASIEQWNGSFLIPNLLYTILIIPFGCIPAYIMLGKKKK